MAKYTCEFDTEAKTFKMFKDGEELTEVVGGGINLYQYEKCCEDGKTETKKEMYVSVTKKDPSGGRITYNYSVFDDEYSESESKTSYAEKMFKELRMAKAMANLNSKLSKI